MKFIESRVGWAKRRREPTETFRSGYFARGCAEKQKRFLVQAPWPGAPPKKRGKQNGRLPLEWSLKWIRHPMHPTHLYYNERSSGVKSRAARLFSGLEAAFPEEVSGRTGLRQVFFNVAHGGFEQSCARIIILVDERGKQGRCLPAEGMATAK